MLFRMMRILRLEVNILTKSSKSPASIAKTNKQWGDLLVSGRVQALSDKLRSSYLVMSK